MKGYDARLVSGVQDGRRWRREEWTRGRRMRRGRKHEEGEDHRHEGMQVRGGKRRGR